LVDTVVSHCWLLEACNRACTDHLRPAVLVACISTRNVHRCNVRVCECCRDTVSPDHSTHFCLYRNVSLVDHRLFYAFKAWETLSCVWAAKDRAYDATALGLVSALLNEQASRKGTRRYAKGMDSKFCSPCGEARSSGLGSLKSINRPSRNIVSFAHLGVHLREA